MGCKHFGSQNSPDSQKDCAHLDNHNQEKLQEFKDNRENIQQTRSSDSSGEGMTHLAMKAIGHLASSVLILLEGNGGVLGEGLDRLHILI